MHPYYKGRVAVVTGAASGIGLALCEGLIGHGAQLVVLADLNAEKLAAETVRLRKTYPEQVLAIQVDVTQPSSVAAMIRQATEAGRGELHFLFNNAGLGLGKAFDAATEDDWRFAFEINFHGALLGIRSVLPVMRAQGGGHIINTGSGIAFSPMAYQSMYSATKAALVALTSSLRYELWDENIRFTSAIPGTVATPIWQGNPPATAISPEESARAILQGVAANERIVLVTEPDRNGAANAFRPEAAKGVDEYLLAVARERRKGNTRAV